VRTLIVMAILAGAGCDRLLGTQPCTAIGCGFPFQVDFSKASPWRSGNFRVEVETDGVKAACEAQLPFASCAVAIPCEGPAEWRLGLSGCALPADSHAISGLTFNTTRPTSVRVSVFHDGRAIGTGSFSPAYVTSRPNGGNCDPECRTAPAASLALE
jgi:hypothetical protein